MAHDKKKIREAVRNQMKESRYAPIGDLRVYFDATEKEPFAPLGEFSKDEINAHSLSHIAFSLSQIEEKLDSLAYGLGRHFSLNSERLDEEKAISTSLQSMAKSLETISKKLQ